MWKKADIVLQYKMQISKIKASVIVIFYNSTIGFELWFSVLQKLMFIPVLDSQEICNILRAEYASKLSQLSESQRGPSTIKVWLAQTYRTYL